MSKVYKYGDKSYTQEQIDKSAKDNGVSVDQYIKDVGFKIDTPNGNGKSNTQTKQPQVYYLKDKQYTQPQLENAAKDNEVNVDTYIKDIGFKKKSGTEDGNTQSTTLSTTPLRSQSQGSSDNNTFPTDENVFTQSHPEPTPQGIALDHVNNFKKEHDELKNSIISYNKLRGTQYNPDDILSSAQKTSDFLQQVKQDAPKRKVELLKNKQAAILIQSEYPNTEKFNQNISAITSEQFNPESFINKADDYIKYLNDHIVNQTIKEDKKDAIPKEQTIAKIAKRLDPKGYAKSIELTKPQDVPDAKKVINWLGNKWDNAFGGNDKNDLLNAVKGGAELKYNEGLENLANDKISAGVLNNDQAQIDEGKIELKNVDKDAIYKYPSLVKQEIVRRVNDRIAEEEGAKEGQDVLSYREKITGANATDYQRLMKDMGYLDDPRTKDIAEQLFRQPELFADESYFGSVESSFVSPFKNLLNTTGDLVGFRNEKDIYTDKLRDQSFPKEVSGTKNSTIRNIANTTANLAGMMAIATVTEGLGTEAGLSAKAAERLGAYTSFGLPAYDPNLKEAYDITDNPIAQKAYATMGAILNAEGGAFLDLGKISRVPGISEAFSKLAKGVSEKTITEDAAKELLEKQKNKYVDFAVKYGTNVTKGAATMAYFDATNNILRASFGDPSVSSKDILPKAAHAFIDGVTGMSIMGLFGAAADIRNEKNTTYKGFIYDMAVNHDAAADIFKVGLDKGDYTQGEYNQKIAILNAAKLAKNTVDAAQVERNTLLNENQKAVYVANKTTELFLNKKIENTQNEELKSKYEKQVKQLNKQNSDIFEGLKFTATLEPLYDLHEAEKKYNEELDKFKSGESENDNALLEAKQKYTDLQYKYFEQRKLPSNEPKTEGEIKPEPIDLKFPQRNDDFAFKYFNDAEKEKYAQLELDGKQDEIAKMISDKKEEILSQQNQKNEEAQKANAEKVNQQGTGTTDASVPSIEKITVGDMLDKKGSYKGQRGTFVQSGQTVEFHTDKGNRIYELGNVNDIKDNSIKDFDIEHEQSIVNLNDNGTVESRGNKYTNPESENPLKAIQRNKDGDITGVKMLNENGKVVTFRGQRAEDLAYQLHLKEITKDNATTTDFEQHINEDAAARQEINDARLSENTETGTTKDNATVSREKIEPKVKTIEVVKPEVKPKPNVTEQTTVEPTGKTVEINNEQQPQEAANVLQGTYDRLLSEGSNPDDPEMIALKQQIDDLSKKEPVEEKPPTEITPTDEAVDIESSHPAEVSLQRKSLMKQVQDIFFKPKDGSKSVSDDTVLNNAVNTLAKEATESGKSIEGHLRDKINDWYSEVFDKNGERKRDPNNANVQKLLTNEQQAMMGIHALKIAQKIKDLKLDEGNPIAIAQLENLESEQLKLQMLTGVVGESAGSSLRYLSQIYRFTNDGNFEVFRKTASSILGADMPLDQKQFDKFRGGLNPYQQKAADIIHKALLKAKKITDEVRDRVVSSDELYKKWVNDEVKKRLKVELGKTKPEPKEVKPKEGKKYSEKAKEYADKFRKLKSKPFTFKDDNGNEIPINTKGTTWNDLVELGAKAIEKTGNLVDGISAIVDKIKDEDWYQKLSVAGKQKLQDDLTDHYKSETAETPEEKNIARLEKQLDDLRQGKRPEIKDKRELSKAEQDLKDQIEDEKKKLGIVRSKKNIETPEEKNIAYEEELQGIVNDIKDLSKNANTNKLTNDAVSKNLIKKLFIKIGNRGRGVDVENISEEAAKILADNGIETDVNDLNEAYIKRGKYHFDKLDNLNKGEKSVTKQITEHEKLTFDINELDKKIKEVNDNGELSLHKKDEQTKKLNQQKEDKYREFEKTLNEKGIKLERGSKESREAKTEVINSYNESVSELGKKIEGLLNDKKFDNLRPAQKELIRNIAAKLKHTINAHDLNGQMDLIKAKVNTILGDLFKDQATKEKTEDIRLRGHDGILEVQKELKKIATDFSANRQKRAEEIKLAEYKKRLNTQRNEYIRKKSAGEFDNTKSEIDIKNDAESYNLNTEMKKAKYDFYREVQRAKEINAPKFIKVLRGARELTRNLLLSGVTYIQGKLALSAITRNLQFPSRIISSLLGKALGVESARNRIDVAAYWRGVSETVKAKTTKQIAEIMNKSGKQLDDATNNLNNANEEYRNILIKNNGYENSKEALAFKTNQLSVAQAEYNVAALQQAVNNIYNKINPLDKGGRWILLKQGVTKEEAELGMLGKKETFRDYLNEPYDESLDNEARVKEMNQRLNTLPAKLKRGVQAAIFASKSLVRFHGLWKDIPTRQAEVEGYIKRLKAEQEKPNGMDISDISVQNKLWNDAVAWDGQEAKFQDKNKTVEAIRAMQEGGANLISGGNENIKNVAEVLTTMGTPVLKIPYNIFKTAIQYNFGIILGTVKAIDILAKARGENLSFKDYLNTKMTEEQRYKFLTVIGRGTVGATMMAGAAIMMNNGTLVMGGQYPDKKKSIMIDGKLTELQYGDIAIEGKLLPHWLSLAISHLPNFYPAITGYYAQEDYERSKGAGKGGDVLDDLYSTSLRLVSEIPDLPLERSVNKYGEETLDFKNPYSYLGYVGAVKDVERALDLGKDKAKQYELTYPQKIFDNAGLLFLVPSEKEAKAHQREEQIDNLQGAHEIRKEFPYLFKKGYYGNEGGTFKGGGASK